ncbi:hypothetical protein PSHT_00745 [Puccinia striiformis]|uniref:Uncharacterized protein n=1 Tax=Puccinia striiformis TaxID=27350 RepID=A0A2S4WMB8_9BASI|nr:hypothetical protein PSHT_00745 [Puccinia striiformis]
MLRSRRNPKKAAQQHEHNFKMTGFHYHHHHHHNNNNNNNLAAEIQRPHSTAPANNSSNREITIIIHSYNDHITPTMPHGLPALQNTSTIHPHYPRTNHYHHPLRLPLLTRANSLPDKPQRPITARSVTTSSPRVNPPPKPSLSIKRTHTSPGPTRARLPTSPKPASAVTVASGLTVSGRMVEYESDHTCRREALSRVLRAVSQSGSGRSRHHDRQSSSGGPSPSYTASSGGENERTRSAGGMTPSRSQEGFRRSHRSGGRTTPSSTPPTPTVIVLSSSSSRPQNDNDETKTDQEDDDGFPFRYTNNNCHLHPPPPPPGSQASGYISFASLNLFAPPSPPESCAGGFLADDEQEIIHSDALMIHPKPIRLKLPHSSRT